MRNRKLPCVENPILAAVLVERRIVASRGQHVLMFKVGTGFAVVGDLKQVIPDDKPNFEQRVWPCHSPKPPLGLWLGA